MSEDEKKPIRVSVDYIYEAINPEFLHGFARIGGYAAEKYGAWDQYTHARLVGEKSPLNHAQDHMRQFRIRKPYDRWDGDIRWHLVAAGYNLMMEYFYTSKWGPIDHPLVIPAATPAAAERHAFTPGPGGSVTLSHEQYERLLKLSNAAVLGPLAAGPVEERKAIFAPSPPHLGPFSGGPGGPGDGRSQP